MLKSKNVHEGSLLARRLDKYICASRYSKPVGVWTNGGTRKTLTLEGEHIVTEFPAGVVVYGPVGVLKDK